MELTQLFTLVGRGDLAGTKDALAAGVDPNTPHPIAGQTLLYNACASDNVAMIELLLSHGANPNQRIKYRSPVDGRAEDDLVVLMIVRSQNAARALVTGGADVNISDSNGLTPLMAASKNGNVEVVRELLSNGARLDEKDVSGHSARDYSVAKMDFYKNNMKSASEKDLERICGPLNQVCRILEASAG